MDPEFTLVVNKRKPGSPLSQRSTNIKKIKRNNPPAPAIITKNTFEVLSDASDTDDSPNADQDTITQQRQPPSQNTDKVTVRPTRPKIPPIVLHGNPSNTNQLKNFIEKYTPDKKYEVRYGKNKTTIFVHDKNSYDGITKKLKECSFNFHTYTTAEQKTHSFVLCGLSKDTDVEELAQALQEVDNLHFKKVYKMNKTQSPKFLVITASDVTEKTISNVRVINNTRIKWERYYNKKIFTQCHRCQEWGHATTNCFSTPKCLKCAQPHITKDCKLTEDDEPTCANCEGHHPANSTECSVYQRLISNYENTHAATKEVRKTPNTPVPDVKSQSEFRPLPTKNKSDLDRTWRRNETSNQTSNQTSNSKTEYDAMMNELKRLNNLIDIRKFTENLRNLNNRLEKCTSESQKFMTMQSFYTEMDANGP